MEVINRSKEILWPNNEAVGKLQCFDVLPTVTSLKLFDTPYNPAQRTKTELSRISYNSDNSKRFHWLYEADVHYMIQQLLGKSEPNGLETLNDNELEVLANYIKDQGFEYIVTDDEGPDAWWRWPGWTYASAQKISIIANKIDQKTSSSKKYFDWFHKSLFTYNGKILGFLVDNGTFQSSSTTTVNDYLDFYSNPSLATGFWDSSPMSRCGWGYTSVTYKPDNAGNSQYFPSNVHFGAIPSYLKSLCGVNSALAVNPNKNIIYILWPREDQERLSYKQVRYKPKSLDGQVNPEGHVRMLEERLTYPPNLISDNVFLIMCNPRVTRMHAWIKPNSEDPFDILRYTKRNWQDSCSSAILPFIVGNYEGNDNPPCPSSGLDYYGEEAIGFNAIMQGVNRYAPLQYILDGTQVGSCPSFSYKRENNSSYINVSQISDLSEFARSWKYQQPFIKVWSNNTLGKKVVLFQDMFAECDEPIYFRVTINGTQYEHVANGNEVFCFVV